MQRDSQKPRVRRTPYTRTWYWKCDPCERMEIMSGTPHHEVLIGALRHANTLTHQVHSTMYVIQGAFS